MANQEQLDILKQGVEIWNKWRGENPDVEIDLSEASIMEADLSGIFLSQANLIEAHFVEVNLSGAFLSKAELSGAHFVETDLTDADLTGAILGNFGYTGPPLRFFGATQLSSCGLGGAHLKGANLGRVDFSNADLMGADLEGSDLMGTDFSGANIEEARFSSAITGNTNFGNIDLSAAIGLEDIHHISPSQISLDTFLNSKGKIPKVFLRGCGLSDWEIEVANLYNPDLSNAEINDIQYKMYDLRATQALQIAPLFISYSHADSTFVDKFEKGLNEKGVRFWRDIHNLTSGKIETQLDRAIRQNPTVLLILSKNSMSSDWVQHEVRKARELEKELGRDVLCPIALDDSWNTESNHWPQRMMEQVKEYKILDFSKWEDESIFQAEFGKLLNGLDVFYKKPEA